MERHSPAPPYSSPIPSPCGPLKGMGEYMLALVCESAPQEQLASWLRVPLEHAAARGDLPCVEKLLSAGANPCVQRRNIFEDRSPLVAAARGGNEAVVAALLERGASPDGEFESDHEFNDDHGGNGGGAGVGGSVCSEEDNNRWSPLHCAASGGHVAAVRALVRAGAETDVPDREGCTPLHLAVFRGYAEVVEELVSAGAAVDTHDSEGETPLHTAAGQGNLVMVQAILRASPEMINGNGGVHLLLSPLHRAALGGHRHVMRELLAHGASLDSLACNARTALHACAMSGSGAAVQFLLERQVDLEAVDHEGCTAVHLAAGHRLGSEDTLLTLLRAGANMEARNGGGETALHRACKALRVGSVKLLLRWDADEAAVDSESRTPAAVVSQLLQTQCPGVFRDRLDEILVMLDNAPADRLWRRRGWLIVLRARRQRREASSNGLPAPAQAITADSPAAVVIARPGLTGAVGMAYYCQRKRHRDSFFHPNVGGGEGRGGGMGWTRGAIGPMQESGVLGLARDGVLVPVELANSPYTRDWSCAGGGHRDGNVGGVLGGGDGAAGGAAGVRVQGEAEMEVEQEDGFGSAVKRAVRLDEEGVFRTLVGFM